MATELFGRPIEHARERRGWLAQTAAVESSIVTDGPSAGMRRIRMTAGDIDLELLPDRGLDLGHVRVGGVPLAWLSPTGFPRAGVHDADGSGFTRAFGGGLLTTCGLQNVGPAAEDGGEQHPMHGRYTSLPATVARTEATDGEVVVEAVVREAAVFGVDLELRRRVTLVPGERIIRVEDVLTNRGVDAVEPMVLYHLNFGWPLVDEGTRLRTPATAVRPRDEQAAAGADTWDTFPAPSHPYPEQVFAHELPADERVAVEVVNPRGLSVAVRFDTAQLPGLFQWRVAQPGLFVLGVEPALVPTILGRAAAREQGLLRPLAPGAALTLGVEIEASGSLS